MKFKKILAIIAAASMAITAFSSVAMAGSYGSPVLTGSVETADLSDDFGDPAYANCLAVTVSYSGFEGFSAYKSMTGKGVGITAAQVKLGYDTEKLEYIATLDGDFADGTAGGTDPIMAYAWANASMKAATSGDFMVAYFLVKDGVDFSAQSATFTFDEYQFTVTNSTNKTTYTNEVYGNIVDGSESVTAEAFTYGSGETPPPTPTKYAVNFDPADVTVTLAGVAIDANTEVDADSVISVAAVAKDGFTAQLKCNGENADEGDFTVTAPVEFTVEYTAIPTPQADYRFTVADYGTSESAAAIYYKLNIVRPDTAMTLGLSIGRSFTAQDLPQVDGEAELTMTYVMKNVPASIRENMPTVSSLTGAVNGETYEEVK